MRAAVIRTGGSGGLSRAAAIWAPKQGEPTKSTRLSASAASTVTKTCSRLPAATRNSGAGGVQRQLSSEIEHQVLVVRRTRPVSWTAGITNTAYGVPSCDFPEAARIPLSPRTELAASPAALSCEEIGRAQLLTPLTT